MNALVMLTEQHAKVDALIAKVEKAKDAGEKKAHFDELADKLAAHATVEERIFYPAVKAAGTVDMLHEAVEEHLAVKRVLADLLDLEVMDETFDSKLKVMKEQLEHHAHKEEEKKLFPAVRKLLSNEQLVALGGEMIAMYEELLEDAPRLRVPSETEEASAV
jgi:hemerythrin superfamily protein